MLAATPKNIFASYRWGNRMYKKKYDGEMSDKIDIKVFILFLLDELKYPMGESIIREIVSENGVVGRFDFAECFYDS